MSISWYNAGDANRTMLFENITTWKVSYSELFWSAFSRIRTEYSVEAQ